MPKYGSQEKLSKEAVQAKWNETQPEGCERTTEYHRLSSEMRGDRGESASHSYDEEPGTLMSAISTPVTTLNNVRSRATSNASSHSQLQQQQLIFDQQQQQQQHQQTCWDSRE